jgi:hypothetical protein
MNRRGAGVVFCFIAAFLIVAKFISAAIFGSNISTWGEDLFSAMLQYTGPTLVVLSIISLLIGIVYLILAEREK